MVVSGSTEDEWMSEDAAELAAAAAARADWCEWWLW